MQIDDDGIGYGRLAAAKDHDIPLRVTIWWQNLTY